MGKFIDLTGQKFGKLTVIKRADKDRHGNWWWWCECECTPNKLKKINGQCLRKGETVSCGCHIAEIRGKASTTHGLSGTRFHGIWRHMKYRCNNPKCDKYDVYGGRGIKVCEEWDKSFEAFRDDMYESYLQHVEEFGEKETTLDRIDVDGNYCKENCEWATWKEQFNNKQDTVYLTYNGETHTRYEWEKILGINRKVIESRQHKGLPIEDILYKGNLCTKYAEERGDNKFREYEQNGRWEYKLEFTLDGITHTMKQWSDILGIKIGTMRKRFRQGKPVEDILYVGNLMQKYKGRNKSEIKSN